MTPETIQFALKMRPFRAFQIHTMGGWEYPLNDPDLAQVSDSTLTLLAAGPGNTTSRVAVIDLASVTSLTIDAPIPEKKLTFHDLFMLRFNPRVDSCGAARLGLEPQPGSGRRRQPSRRPPPASRRPTRIA